MIAVGLSWKMAIGACVLGNTLMGLVITVNGRIGAKVGRLLPPKTANGLLEIAPYSLPRTCPHAVWLLLQLLCGPVSLRACHCMARRANHHWWPMYGCSAHSNLAKLCQHSQHHTGIAGYLDIWNDCFLTVLPAPAALPLHSLHEGMCGWLMTPFSLWV